VNSRDTLEPFLNPLAALQRLIDRLDGQGLIIGGIAASLLGRPRLTADLDAMVLVSVQDLSRLLRYARQEGLVPRIENAQEFARRNRVLLLMHQETGIPVDISLGALPFEIEAVQRSQIHKVGSLKIRLPTPEDLIIFKAVAHRPQDLLDIQAIIDNYPNLDRDRIELWVQSFAEALEIPELWEDIADWFSRPS
jgi:hypothetical protein